MLAALSRRQHSPAVLSGGTRAPIDFDGTDMQLSVMVQVKGLDTALRGVPAGLLFELKLPILWPLLTEGRRPLVWSASSCSPPGFVVTGSLPRFRNITYASTRLMHVPAVSTIDRTTRFTSLTWERKQLLVSATHNREGSAYTHAHHLLLFLNGARIGQKVAVEGCVPVYAWSPPDGRKG